MGKTDWTATKIRDFLAVTTNETIFIRRKLKGTVSPRNCKNRKALFNNRLCERSEAIQ